MNKKSSMSSRKGLAALVAVILLLCVAAGGTLAWITAQSEEVTNTFEPGEVPPVIQETISNNAKSDIKVKNSGNVNAYLRVAVVMNWVNEQGNYVYGELPSLPIEYGENWVLKNGYYYYTKSVAPGSTTDTPIFTGEITESGAPNGCHLQVAILAESIQADGVGSDGFKPVMLAWGVDPSTLNSAS
ncbi:hypothetical protein [Evtepia sp.]|uniref:hypothetical protein n=1 Tax=Evtepia sp. TaxID=2773933 RepID=UPI003F17616E